MSEKDNPWSRYEQQISFEKRFSPELPDTLARILQCSPPLVRHMMFWECRRGWNVRERRLSDNLMLFVLEGEEEITVGGDRNRLRRGDVVVIPEFVPHRMKIAPGCDRCRHFIAHWLAADITEGNPFAGFSSTFLHPEGADGVIRMVELIASLYEEKGEVASALLSTLLRQLMITEAGALRFSFPGLRIRDARIRKALGYIRDHYREDISVREMARFVNLGEVRFRTLFREETGMLPGSCLLHYRITHAADDMIRNSMGIKEAAFLNGFSSASYFCVVFRQIMLMTPGEYRKNFYRA